MNTIPNMTTPKAVTGLVSRLKAQGTFHWFGKLHRRDSVWGLADQVIVSGTNFMLMVVSARILEPYEFGVFSLAFLTLSFTLMVERSLIGTPHNVIGIRLAKQHYRDFTRSAAIGQILLIIVFQSLLVIAACVCAYYGWLPSSLLLAMLLPLASLQWLEFTRRVLYTEGRIKTATQQSVAFFVAQTVVLSTLWVSGTDVGISLLFVMVFVSSTTAAALGTYSIRTSASGRFRRDYAHEIWTFGGWLGGSTLVSGLANQAYLYGIALVLSPAAVGTLRASDSLVRPLALIPNLLEAVLPAKFSKVHQELGLPGLRHQINFVGSSFILLGAGSLTLLALWGQDLTNLFFGPGYAAFTWIPVIYGILYVGNGLVSIISAGIRSLQYGKSLFNVSLLCTVGTLPIAVWGMERHGIYGAAAGLVLPVVARLLILSQLAMKRLGWKPVLTLSR